MNHKLILIRHAVTTAEKSALVGKNDIPLSDQGVNDAKNLRTGIKVQSTDITYHCSTLSRAVQTAGILFPNAEFKRHEQINEIDFGQWSGLDIHEVSKLYPEAMDEWSRSPLSFRFPGGESVSEFIKRITDYLDTNILNHTGPNVVVCHGGVIRFIFCRMLNLDYSHHLAFSVHRPSLNVIDHDGNSGVLTGLNLTDLTI